MRKEAEGLEKVLKKPGRFSSAMKLKSGNADSSDQALLLCQISFKAIIRFAVDALVKQEQKQPIPVLTNLFATGQLPVNGLSIASERRGEVEVPALIRAQAKTKPQPEPNVTREAVERLKKLKEEKKERREIFKARADFSARAGSAPRNRSRGKQSCNERGQQEQQQQH